MKKIKERNNSSWRKLNKRKENVKNFLVWLIQEKAVENVVRIWVLSWSTWLLFLLSIPLFRLEENFLSILEKISCHNFLLASLLKFNFFPYISLPKFIFHYQMLEKNNPPSPLPRKKKEKTSQSFSLQPSRTIVSSLKHIKSSASYN